MASSPHGAALRRDPIALAMREVSGRDRFAVAGDERGVDPDRHAYDDALRAWAGERGLEELARAPRATPSGVSQPGFMAVHIPSWVWWPKALRRQMNAGWKSPASVMSSMRKSSDIEGRHDRIKQDHCLRTSTAARKEKLDISSAGIWLDTDASLGSLQGSRPRVHWTVLLVLERYAPRAALSAQQAERPSTLSRAVRDCFAAGG
ncbi:hypothetical protein B0H14DRAFT_3124613 [Mycena olivaceomarginata]|nr:hypothetical protein B0H14DRAFT_3124613 [Mycena olivaceomarginata]